MSTSSTPLTVDPLPSATTDTSQLPMATPSSAAISAEDWQPQPALTMAVEDLAAGCLIPAVSPEYYFLDLGTRYELLDIRVDRNYSLTNLQLSGYYYLGGETVPESRPESQPLRANFGGQDMVLAWSPTGRCARFTFTFGPGSDTLPETSVHGPLILTQLVPIATPPRILISGVDAILSLQSSPQATPTLGGELDSTADSSIGQSTNQTAAPASGNVPVSSASSSSSPKASVLAPAIVVPVVVILAALAGFFLWRRHRRARLAPSAAFRADHADAVEAMERQGATVGLGGTGTTQLPTAGVSLPAQSSSYFPLDEKRPMGP